MLGVASAVGDRQGSRRGARIAPKVDNFLDFAPRASLGGGLRSGRASRLAPLGGSDGHNAEHSRPPAVQPGAKVGRRQVLPLGALPAPLAAAKTKRVVSEQAASKKPITHKFITERKAGWTFTDMLRDRKELENLQALRAELLLEAHERRRLERSTLCECYVAWALLGIVHGGQWLVLAAKANDPRLRYLAKTNIRALRGSLKKVETLIRTLEQHHDSVSPDSDAHTDAVDEDERRRRLVVVGASNLSKPSRLGTKIDPYVVVRLDGEWIGQTHPVFNTTDPEWGAEIEFVLPDSVRSGGVSTLQLEVYDHDAAAAGHLLGKAAVDLEYIPGL